MVGLGREPRAVDERGDSGTVQPIPVVVRHDTVPAESIETDRAAHSYPRPRSMDPRDDRAMPAIGDSATDTPITDPVRRFRVFGTSGMETLHMLLVAFIGTGLVLAVAIVYFGPMLGAAVVVPMVIAWFVMFAIEISKEAAKVLAARNRARGSRHAETRSWATDARHGSP